MNRLKQALERTRSKAEAERQKDRGFSRQAAHPKPGAIRSRSTFEVEDKTLLMPEERAERMIIHPGMDNSGIEDSILSIRAAALRRSLGDPCSILVTQAISKTGSQFVSTNLAAAFAGDEHMSAILVNCNPGRPSNLFNDLTDNEYGLFEFLSSPKGDVRKLLQPVGIERLRLINTGSRSDRQPVFLTAARFKRLFDSIRIEFPDSFLIFDAPPVTESSDARVIADECDMAILVAEYGKATNVDVRESIDIIGIEKLLGVVLNDQPIWPFGMRNSKT